MKIITSEQWHLWGTRPAQTVGDGFPLSKMRSLWYLRKKRILSVGTGENCGSTIKTKATTMQPLKISNTSTTISWIFSYDWALMLLILVYLKPTLSELRCLWSFELFLIMLQPVVENDVCFWCTHETHCSLLRLNYQVLGSAKFNFVAWTVNKTFFETESRIKKF